MLLSFTPNPCFERTLRLENFRSSATFRVDSPEILVTAGGKGINSARVAQNLGLPAHVLTFVGNQQIGQFRALLENDDLRGDLIATESPTRTTMAVVSSENLTEIIENGVAPTLSEGAQLLEKWRELLPHCALAVIGGSYAPSSERGWHLHGALLCQLAAGAGKRVIYDGKGEAFVRALHCPTPPWAIKPNLEEAAATWGKPIETPAQERGAIRYFLARGVEVVLLSCGARGLYVGYNRQIEWFAAPAVETISPVGSGDSLVGAFCAKFAQCGDVFEAARWGVAAGSANAAQLGAAQVKREDVQNLVPQVRRQLSEIRLEIA